MKGVATILVFTLVTNCEDIKPRGSRVVRGGSIMFSKTSVNANESNSNGGEGKPSPYSERLGSEESSSQRQRRRRRRRPGFVNDLEPGGGYRFAKIGFADLETRLLQNP